MSSSIPASTPGKPWQPLTPEELQPELPQYAILGLLGRGGMGAVYKAVQKSLGREVAIKVLPPTIDDGGMRFSERFLAEANAQARLNHPNIVSVFDAGETPGGLLYMVMEYVQGTDVSQMIRSSGKLPPEHAYAIVAHVCEALAYAHGNGIIHRDIKPANVMVDTQGRVKIADFGLAKLITEDSGYTQSNMAVGTPDFVAPEALILGMPVDGRADLYAVGVMLYQMLTGSIPRGAFKPASVIVPGLDARFDQIVFKAMQVDREERHSSALELRQHLDTLLIPAVSAPDLQRYSSAQMPKTPPAAPKPTGKPPQPKSTTGTPARQDAAPAGKSAHGTSPAPKSKAPLFIGLGITAAVAIGAFVMFGGKAAGPPADAVPPKTALGGPSAPPSKATAPVKVSEPPKPAVKPAATAKAPEPKKDEPKPVVVSAPPVASAPAAMVEVKPAAPASAAASATPAKPGPVPARLPDPAKWVKVFDTPESVANRVGFEWSKEGILFSSTSTGLHFTDLNPVDIAIRATFTKFQKGGSNGFSLRNTKGSESAVFVDLSNQGKDVIRISKRKKKGQDFEWATLAEFPFAPPTPTPEMVEVEILAVGKVLMVSVAGKVIGSVLDNEEPGAGFASVFSKSGLIHDMAWQSLDLPNPADEKLAVLESSYQDRIKREADAPFETAVAELAAKLKAALERAVPAVRGSTSETQLRAEISRIEKKEPIPPADEPKLPALLVTLRKTWHTELAKLLTTRTQNAVPAKQAQDQALAALQKELEDKGDITRAERVKQARAHLQKADALPVAVGLAAVKKGPINVRPTKAGKLKMIGCFGNAGLPADIEPFAKYDDYVQVVSSGHAVGALRKDGSAIVQCIEAVAGTPNKLRTYTHTSPPLAKLFVTNAFVLGVTEDGRVALSSEGGNIRKGPWDALEGIVEVSTGDAKKFCAGLKSDGTIVLAMEQDFDNSWMPKAESLPKAKAVKCDNNSLLILTEAGGVIAWDKLGSPVKVPPNLKHGIVQWREPSVYIPTGLKEQVLGGAYLDRQGSFLIQKGGVFSTVAKDVEEMAGNGGHYHYKQKRKPWTFTGGDQYGEIRKATEVLGSGTPISWSLSYNTLSQVYGFGTTGVFVWIE